MATLSELCREHTAMGEAEIEHLQNLTSLWGLLADLSFADLLLYAPKAGEAQAGLVLLGHMRPTTGMTLYRADLVGQTFSSDRRPVVDECFTNGAITEGLVQIGTDREVSIRAVPVRVDGEIVAVLARERLFSEDRPATVQERTYRRVFRRFVDMIDRGDFPYQEEERLRHRTPRVGDGLLLVDSEGRIEFASPNAVSALHRLGMRRAVVGSRLEDTGLEAVMLRQAFARRAAVISEPDEGHEVDLVSHCFPLLDGRTATGAIVLVRDVTDLRRRDRQLVSKDATIREVHHRVKNNLQTISSLLRLQGRRLKSVEARAALEESVRRVAAIAVVHETLAQSPDDDVAFTDLVRPLVRVVEESVSSPERPLSFTVEGEAGVLPSQMTTTLAVVLTELLQNAVDHAYRGAAVPESGEPGRVNIVLDRRSDRLLVRVTDDGVGLPEGFNLAESDGLGLTIVRTFVESQLGGTITLSPVQRGTGTVAEVRIPSNRLSGPWDDAQEPVA
ncbi:MAG TPA: ATPase [Acidimicrobiia bacterium]|nr:ATPase [Acidimicrobiia bacterium]HIL46188.1 ATPase [Acidimicrobiia bacterium]